MARQTLRRLLPPLWTVPLLAVAVMAAPFVQVPAKSVASAVLSDGVMVLCAVCIGWVAARQPAGTRLPWALVAAAIVLFIAGDLGWYWVVWTTDQPPDGVSVADVGYLGYYPLITVGMLLMLRRRAPGRDATGALDATILATGCGLLVAVFLILPNGQDGTLPMLDQFVTLSYPVMDLALLTVALRMSIARGRRPLSFMFLVVGSMTMFGADAIYLLQSLDGTYAPGGWLDVAWPLSQALLASAALHPSAGVLLQPMPRPPKEGLTAARLGALAAATLLAPLVAAAAPQQQQRDVALMASGVLFLLVLARLAGLTGALDRTEARFSSLVHHGADPIVVLDSQARVRYASPAWNRLVGEPVCRTDDDTHDCVDLVTRVAPESLDELAGELAALVGSPPGTTAAWTGRLRHGDGSWRHVEAIVTNQLTDAAVRGLVLNVRDVTDRVELAEQLRHAAFHDSLTQLPNRALFVDRVAQMLSMLDRSGGLGAVLFIDLDDFKDVNDTLGHAAGDLLLSTVADRLRGCVRTGDTVARLGGDEFGVLLPSLDDVTEAEVIISRIQAALAVPVPLPTVSQTPGPGRQLTPVASVGLAVTRLPQTPDELLREADLAMYEVKRTRKARIG